jgi:hypothetical protein
MTQKAYFRGTGLMFLLIAVAQVLRLIFGWGTVIGGWAVPQWLSVIALINAGYLAYEGFRLGRE